jgi:hypothetical protein
MKRIGFICFSAITIAFSVLEAQAPKATVSEASTQQRIAALEKEVQILKKELAALRVQLERLGPTTPSPSTGQTPPATVSGAQPRVTTVDANCDTISKEYAKNEFAAAAKYRGKFTVVTGRIYEIGKRTYNPYRNLPYVWTSGSSGSCLFFFPQGSESALSQLLTGQEITIQGQVDGYEYRQGVAFINSRVR